MQEKVEVRCHGCDRLLFKASGRGTEIEIKCTCGRFVDIDANGKQHLRELKQNRLARAG